MAILSPKNINKKLEAWYDASVTSSLLLSGSSLTGWNDLSNTSSHLDTIQGNAPQLSTRKVNNRTVVEFNNDGAVFRTSQIAQTDTPQSTIGFVCVPDAYSGAVVSSKTTLDQKVLINANGTVSAYGSSSSSFTSSNRCKTGEVTRIIVSYNGDSSKVWVNGISTTTPPGFIEDRTLIGMIGAAGSGDTNYFDGLVCEAVIYEDALTDSEVQELDWYFQRKWDEFSNRVRFDTSANGYTRTIYNTSANNTTIDASVPTNVQAGDLMLAVLSTNSGESISLTIPSGWTEIANNYQSDGDFVGQTWIGWKIANTAEPATYTWTPNTANIRDDQSFIFRILGHDGRTNPIDVIGTFGNDSVISVATPSITTTKDDSMAVWVITSKRGDYLIAEDANYPTGTTGVLLKASRTVSSFGINTGVAYEYRKFAGATGTRAWTIVNTSAYKSAIGFAIKQAPYSTVQAERLIETGKVKQFSDNFNRADADDLGPNWNTRVGTIRIRSNQYDGFGATSYADVDSSIVDFSDDHSAQIKITTISTADALGPAVRVTANGCYAIFADGFVAGSRSIVYISGTTRTVIGTAAIAPTVGDILKLSVQGSVLTAYINGVQVEQVSNTAWTTGQPGIFYNRGNINVSKGDDFYAEDLNTPTSGTMVKMYDDGTIRAGYFSEKEYLDRIKYNYDGDVWAGKFIESE